MEVPSDAPEASKKDFKWAWETAKKVVQRRFRVLTLIRTAYAKMARHDSALQQVKEDLRTLLRFAQAWANREYRGVPWQTIIYVVGALIYLINPLDAIPDALIGIGFVDDIAVITAVVKALRDDLNAFRAWETSQQEASPPPASAPSLSSEHLISEEL